MTTITKVKTKGQITLPATFRKFAGIKIGDYMKVQIERGKITLSPQTLIDQEINEGLEDAKNGRTYGPFDTADAAISFLHESVKKYKTKKIKK